MFCVDSLMLIFFYLLFFEYVGVLCLVCLVGYCCFCFGE